MALPISERTVELNLTTELVNWMWKVYGATFTVIAPSQRLEAKLGYDAKVRGGGFGFVVQYKRAEIKSGAFQYKLNRTSKQDQHARLCRLEARGVSVFYALPLFTKESEVISGRRRLLSKTLWLRPRAIPVPGGGVGHHEYHYDPKTARHWLTSDNEIEFDPGDTGFEQLARFAKTTSDADQLERVLSEVNETVFDFPPTDADEANADAIDGKDSAGMCILVRADDT